MSTAILDERAERLAQVRAQAAAIADTPRPPRRFTVSPGVRLRPAQRRRRHIRQRAPVAVAPRKTSSLRRIVAAAVLLLQVGLLVAALNLPMFQVHDVALTGTTLLSRDAVLQAAAVPTESIFTVNGDAIRARVLALPWVQEASVTTELPATVRISVVGRSPTLRVRRDHADTLIADSGASLSASTAQLARFGRLPVLLDDRVGSALPVAPALVQLMSVTAQRLQSVLGCEVAAFQWDANNVVAIWASTGWRAVLGHLDTANALAGVPGQLAALSALRDALDFTHPNFGYVDLENAGAPAVGGAPGLPAEVLAARTPLTTAPETGPPAPVLIAPSATPTPAPSPTPPTSPTPYTFTITPPSPSPRS